MAARATILKKAGDTVRGAGKSVGWSTLGLFTGQLVAIFVPHHYIEGANLGYMGSALFLALHQIGIFERFRTARGRTLDDALKDIDQLFVQKRITDKERNDLRALALKEYGVNRPSARVAKGEPSI